MTTVEKLIALLEDKIQEYDSLADDASDEQLKYYEGCVAACRHFLETLEETFLHTDAECSVAIDDDEWLN